jgi:hypothetical protein
MNICSFLIQQNRDVRKNIEKDAISDLSTKPPIDVSIVIACFKDEQILL